MSLTPSTKLRESIKSESASPLYRSVLPPDKSDQIKPGEFKSPASTKFLGNLTNGSKVLFNFVSVSNEQFEGLYIAQMMNDTPRKTTLQSKASKSVTGFSKSQDNSRLNYIAPPASLVLLSFRGKSYLGEHI